MVNQQIVVSHTKTKKGNKKHSNKVKCQLYRTRGVRLRNKIRKLTKYVQTHLNDKQANNRLTELHPIK